MSAITYPALSLTKAKFSENMNIQMDIGHWTMAFFNYWYFFTAGSIAGLGTFGEAPPLLASLLAPWQLIELIASAVNFPSCWPHTFIAPQKSPTNNLQYLSAEISTANSQLLFEFTVSREVLQHWETPNDKSKSLKGKTRWPHELAVRQKGCPANLANCAFLLLN